MGGAGPPHATASGACWRLSNSPSSCRHRRGRDHCFLLWRTSCRPATSLGAPSWGQAGPLCVRAAPWGRQDPVRLREGGVPDTPRAEGARPDPEGGPGRRGRPWGPSRWWASAAPGSPRPHPWPTPQPLPWPFLTGPRGPTQPHPSPHPVSPRLQGASDRQADAGRLGRAHGHRSRGPPLPTGRPTTDPRPGVGGKPSTSGRSPSGPGVTQRTRQESMDRGSISSSFIEKQQHWGPGRRRAMASAPAPVAHGDPPARQPAPPELGAPWGPPTDQTDGGLSQ